MYTLFTLNIETDRTEKTVNDTKECGYSYSSFRDIIIQSTLVISKFKGPSEILLDIRTATY